VDFYVKHEGEQEDTLEQKVNVHWEVGSESGKQRDIGRRETFIGTSRVCGTGIAPMMRACRRTLSVEGR
jgi:hypothetical protein